MDLEGIMVSGISQAEKDKYGITYMQNLENCNKLGNRTGDRFIDIENKFMVTCGRGKGDRQYRDSDEDIQNIMYKLSYNNRMYNTGHIARFYNNYTEYKL